MNKAQKYMKEWGNNPDNAGKNLYECLEDYHKTQSEEDTKRLDKLQGLSKGYGPGWVLRESISGRGIIFREAFNYEDGRKNNN